MNKQLKFQSIITCNCKGVITQFVSNELIINLVSKVNMKNLYTYDKYLSLVANKCNCNCGHFSLLSYLIATLFGCGF